MIPFILDGGNAIFAGQIARQSNNPSAALNLYLSACCSPTGESQPPQEANFGRMSFGVIYEIGNGDTDRWRGSNIAQRLLCL